jgi:beta-RFAP synthase
MFVQTASRLHFGLLAIPTGDLPARAELTEAKTAVPQRYWGGAGLMVDQPGLVLTARPAAEWQAEGPLAGRVLRFVQQFHRSLGKDAVSAIQPLQFTVARCAPEHQGLGTGTQLALAVARILAENGGVPGRTALDLAERVRRGKRSAIGLHGFEQGGFLVEAGKCRTEEISPLIARVAFPHDWRLVLVLPRAPAGLHGLNEVQAFQQLQAGQPRRLRTERLCQLLLQGMLPALREGDLPTFGEALFEFNRRVGEAFRPVQGGIYSHPENARIVSFLRKQQVRGVGQSSWGPALFAVCASEDEAQNLSRQLQARFGLVPEEVVVTGACNHGAVVRRGSRAHG